MPDPNLTLNPAHLTPATPPGTLPASPFLPGTNIQYAWDSTSIGLFKTCPRLYQYTILDGWAAKDESIHLRFGIEYHQALQDYSANLADGISHDDALHAAITELHSRIYNWDPDITTKAGKYKNPRTLYALVIDYLDKYADDPATTFIKSDGVAAVELSFRFELDFAPDAGYDTHSPTPQPYILCGHLDRVVDFNGALYVMDHKTTTTSPSDYYFDQFEPHNQMTLYTLAGQVVLNTPIKGVIISAAQILLTEPGRFVRGFTYRTKDQLTEWLTDLEIHLQAAETYANANYFPQNDTACDKFGGCKFRRICSKSPDVREIFLASDFTKLELADRWNPLKSR